MPKIRSTSTRLFPAPLSPGDTIGIAAPSSPFEIEKFQQGISALKRFGFEVLVPEGLFERNGYLAGSDSHRAALLNSLFAEPEVKGIICARGGFGAMRMLPFLDFDAIPKNPKIFVGFSDASAVLNALVTRCGLIVFHGPVVTSLASAGPKTEEALLNALTKGGRITISPERATVIHPGSVSGEIAGGNLATLCHLIGTDFRPDFAGKILLLEDRGEPFYRIDRMITQMRLSGCFEKLAGLVLGSFESCGDEREIYGIVRDAFENVDIPILAGFEIGHGSVNLTLPLGVDAVLDAGGKTLTLSGGTR